MLSRLSLTSIVISYLASAPHAGAQLMLDCTSLDPSKDGDADTAFLCLADYQQRLETLEAKIATLIDANTGEPLMKSADFADASHGSEAHSETYLTSATNQIPKSAILLSTVACNEFEWQTLQESLGRMPIGAGSIATIRPEQQFVFNQNPDGSLSTIKLAPYRGDHYPPLQAGGAETVTLTEPQMPKHSHSSGNLTAKKTVDNIHMTADKIEVSNNARVLNPLFAPAAGPRNFGGHDHTIEGSTTIEGNSQSHNNMPPFIALYFCKKD